MSKMTAIIATASITAILIAIPVASYVSAYNTGNRLEKNLSAALETNENILAQYSQKIMEATQVPEMMRDDIIEVTTAAIQGRYGPDGARATFQMITEQNPQVSPAVYVKLQQIIEAGRDEFKNGQTRMVDQKRVYEVALGSFWQGFWLRTAGYPKVDMAKYRIVSTAATQETFRTGLEAAPIKLRPGK